MKTLAVSDARNPPPSRSWTTASLPDVTFFQEGPGLRKWQWTNSGMKVINVTNILGDGQIDIANTDRYIALAEFEKKYRHFAIAAGDVLVASSGNTYGKVGRIFLKDLPIMMNTSVIRFHSADKKRLSDEFLFAFLRSNLFHDQVESFVIGSAQPNFGPSHLKRMTMPLPPLNVQDRIAAILSAYDDLIENNLRRIKILEEMARALYREWFVEFRFPGHTKTPLVASAVGPIPKGWAVKGLLDVATVTYGFPFASDKFNTEGTGTPIIRIRDIPTGKSETWTDQDAEEKYQIGNGDILVGMDGDFHMGVWSNGHAYQNQRVAKFQSRGEIGVFHLFLALEKPIQKLNKSIVGTTVAHLGDGHIRKIQIIWPPISMLTKSRNLLEPMSEQIIYLKRQYRNLRNTRDLLLPRLLSGKIDVTEPALAA